MARGRERKTDKGQFNENNMRAAVHAVIQDKISIRQAALRYGLKFQTVFEYVKKQKQNPSAEIRMIPNYACRKIFSKEQESVLADYVLTCSKMCYGQTIINIKKLLMKWRLLMVCLYLKTGMQAKKLGENGFLDLWPDTQN